MEARGRRRLGPIASSSLLWGQPVLIFHAARCCCDAAPLYVLDGRYHAVSPLLRSARATSCQRAGALPGLAFHSSLRLEQ